MSVEDTLRDGVRDGAGQRLEKLSVAQAARALGVTESGVRKRVSRGTLPHERDENGTVWVFVDPLQTVSGTPPNPAPPQAEDVRDTLLDALNDQVATLKDQVRYLQAEGERKDAIIGGLVQRIPQLEAPTDAAGESQESPVSASDGRGSTTGPTEETEQPRVPWWRRFFGFG
jgi:hypothetical protein